MKSVLISIKPKWCELIASGKKTVEVRKTRPKIETPFKVYIYCTKGGEWLTSVNGIVQKPNECSIPLKTGTTVCELNGSVIGEFVCDDIKAFDVPYPAFQNKMDKTIIEKSCVSYYDLHKYAVHDCLFAWNISDLVIYDKPKELSEFFVWKKCNSCRDTGYESTACCFDLDCKVPAVITRPPQDWFYVWESEDEGQ